MRLQESYTSQQASKWMPKKLSAIIARDFQIEFIYRDAKQHCGLIHCQARSQNKLDFHFNAALTAFNLAKIEWLQSAPAATQSFSMSSYKTMYNNDLLLRLFIRKFGINPNTKKNREIIKELRDYGKIAV